MRDISDRVRMERLRQRTERLEAVAELSASLAHEIKNPLASISSSVQQLGLGEDADEDDRLLSQLILKESDRLSRLLSDFIDFARVHIERTRQAA
jgi:two-component system sensor histidine kinase PilS (NtrC family)